MPIVKKPQKLDTGESESIAAGARLDVIFGGPLLFVPAVSDGNVTTLEVFSPNNGHPVGAVFVPEVWFSDAELNDPACERWPAPENFSLLDPHSYSIDLTQQTNQPQPPFPVAGIPDTNHKVKPGRRLSRDWEISIRIHGHLSGWSSQRLFRVTQDLYTGGDAPTTPTAAAMHRLTYTGVIGAEFCGASAKPREYLRANIVRGGSLIVLGEISYQSTLRHERLAIDALAKLAGLDLHLVAISSKPHKTRLMHHTVDCGHSIVVA